MWIDTGGTFTDCLAVDPQGRRHRTKVLTSSCLRGRVAARMGERLLRLEAPWRVTNDFFTGCRFRLLEGNDAGVPVESYRAEGGLLGLAAPLAAAAPGASFEIESPEPAPILAARLVTGTPAAQPLPPLAMRLATTLGTNALLERRGARVVLFITRGFADLLEIGTQQRPELFALAVVKRRPLYAEVVEVPERLAAEGSVLEPLDLEALAPAVERLLEEGVRSAAIALLHAYRNPVHEEALAARLEARGFGHVSCSAALAPRIGFLARAETAVVDAFLAPVLSDYLARIGAAVPREGLHLMTSAGGLVRAAEFRPKDSLLSGPAGGVVGAALAGRRSGFDRLIAFDMGGTSTDVARFDGDYDYRFETRVGDARLMAPALAIESVAAGGGSICDAEGAQLKVGPESAGARPGPACYGAGGPLTITDANLLLGRLDAGRFPIPIDRAAAERALSDLVERLRAAGGAAMATEAVLEGILRIADERMAEAIRRISVRQGYDPREYVVVAFGGAGGQHACAVAELLGVRTVLVPEEAALLSALGLGQALIERFAVRQVLAPLDAVEPRLETWFAELAAEAARSLAGEGAAAGEIVVRRRMIQLRLLGQEAAVALDCLPGANLRPAFAVAYECLYGYPPPPRPVEVASLEVVVSTGRARMDPPRSTTGQPGSDSPRPGTRCVARAQKARGGDPAGVRRAVYLAGGWRKVPSFERETLAPGFERRGPCLVFERHSATFVAEDWRLAVAGPGALVLTRESGR